MIKKTFFIVLILSAYVYIVSADKEGRVLAQVKALYNYFYSTVKHMDIEVHVNKLSLDKYPD